MFTFIRRLALALMITLPLSAQADPIQSVISKQITAFLADDFETAFSYASPSIQRMFGTPERFGQMVRDGYPMVYRPTDVRMLEQKEIGPHVIQNVLMRDSAGRLHMLAYAMIETPDGWQINGVQILRAPEVGA